MCQHCGSKTPHTDGEHFINVDRIICCMNIRDSRTEGDDL